MTEKLEIPVDPAIYRQILGQYPTGVCVITGLQPDGSNVAMVVGSFTSVSLSPPLVGFFPDKRSTSWSKLRTCHHFCVHILAADQEHICRKLSSKDPDKFSDMPHSLTPNGLPLLPSVVAQIECVMHSISDAGDHELALGLVVRMELVTETTPLIFCQGSYGRFSRQGVGTENAE